MKEEKHEFDELRFFASVKNRPGMYFGEPSLLSMRDYLNGMKHAFHFCGYEDKFRYFNLFREWYMENVIKDENSYAAWWNHMLYISGNHDRWAFELFFREFEKYLSDVHNLFLPETE